MTKSCLAHSMGLVSVPVVDRFILISLWETNPRDVRDVTEDKNERFEHPFKRTAPSLLLAHCLSRR